MPYNLPSYEQQQAIKQDTENILSNFPIKSGTDWSQYENHFGGTVDGVSQTGLEQTFVDISGEGFLTSCVIKSSGSASNGILTITADGIVVYKGKFSSTGYNAGVTIYNDAIVTGGSYDNLPFNDQNTVKLIRLPKPIFFKSSLLVKCTPSTTGIPTVMYCGAVK